MEQLLKFSNSESPFNVLCPIREIGAYEALWQRSGMTFKKVAEFFRVYPGQSPSEIIGEQESNKVFDTVKVHLPMANPRFGIRVNGDALYPSRLRDAVDPVELLYFKGDWALIDSPSVAIVGTKNPSQNGLKRTRKLVKSLVQDGFTIMSGLAAGIDTEAHKSAIEFEGHTIAILGTPISNVYPKKNSDLQKWISENQLLISQVPFLRYYNQDYRSNRGFFPERYKTMSALSLATIIVEASNTSGTLIQARAALEQGRKLFILDNCFKNKTLSWPQKFEKKGAIRVKSYDDIKQNLAHASTDRD